MEEDERLVPILTNIGKQNIGNPTERINLLKVSK